MHSIDAYPSHQGSFQLPKTGIIKIIIAVLVVAYACYKFTAPQFLFLTVIAALAVLVANIVSNMKSHNVKNHGKIASISTGISNCTDGGTFSHKHSQQSNNIKGRKVVLDGGSFEHS